MNDKIKIHLKGIAEIYSKNMSDTAAMIFINAIGNYPESVVIDALNSCVRELKTFPTINDVLARIQANDGRPGIEEAWAMMPRCEDDTIVWTEEMAESYSVVYDLIKEDLIAARMTFKEVYSKKVQDARNKNMPVKWMASLGHDKKMREAVITDAVNKKRLDYQHAKQLLPNIQVLDQAIKNLIAGSVKEIPTS